MYILVRNSDGAYVACPGSQTSYTKSILRARVFRTREEADRERCPGNESITKMPDLNAHMSRNIYK